MTRLPKEQRDKLILTIMGTAVILAGLYFGLISFQEKQVHELEAKKQQELVNADAIEKSIQNSKKIEADLIQRTAELATNEDDMATGDPYLWMVNTLRKFKLGHNVEIQQFSGISYPDTGLLPRLAYKQVSIDLGGTGYYHDIGTFVADFENHFRHMRIQYITLEPPNISAADRDKLTFRMQIVALVKPGA